MGYISPEIVVEPKKLFDSDHEDDDGGEYDYMDSGVNSSVFASPLTELPLPKVKPATPLAPKTPENDPAKAAKIVDHPPTLTRKVWNNALYLMTGGFLQKDVGGKQKTPATCKETTPMAKTPKANSSVSKTFKTPVSIEASAKDKTLTSVSLPVPVSSTASQDLAAPDSPEVTPVAQHLSASQDLTTPDSSEALPASQNLAASESPAQKEDSPEATPVASYLVPPTPVAMTPLPALEITTGDATEGLSTTLAEDIEPEHMVSSLILFYCTSFIPDKCRRNSRAEKCLRSYAVGKGNHLFFLDL